VEMKDFTDRQREIIKASVELIAEKGIQQLTIKNLSKKIGTVEGAIYRHFDSKIDILLGILDMFRENKKQTLGQIQLQNVSPSQQLETIFIECFKHFSKNPAIAAVIFSEEIFQNDKRLADEVFHIMQESLKIVETIIAKGQKTGKFRQDISAEKLTLLIIGALRLIVTKWRLSNFSFDLQKEGWELWKNIDKIVTK
jgi:AcrR family transcriptional regulator